MMIIDLRQLAIAGAVLLLIALWTTAAALGQSQTTFRDASGRATGTATTDSQGTTTFRDAGGRTIGTANPNGTTGSTTFRDDRGRTTGTASTPSWEKTPMTPWERTPR